MSNHRVPATGEAMPDVKDPSLSALEALIARHAEAFRHESDLMNALEEPETPRCRVQVGKRLIGHSDDGTQIFEPIWAYSPKMIDEHEEPHRKAVMGFFGRTEEERVKIRERYDKWAEAKKAELAALEAERKRIEDETGFTAAWEELRQAGLVVTALEAEICSFVPSTLAAAARQARWAIDTFIDGDGYIDAEKAVDILRSIAKAGK